MVEWVRPSYQDCYQREDEKQLHPRLHFLVAFDEGYCDAQIEWRHQRSAGLHQAVQKEHQVVIICSDKSHYYQRDDP